MGKFLKPGKVVILLTGRHAGKKAVIVKSYDEGTKDRSYGHCLVAGVEKAPLSVTKTMGEKRLSRRVRVKPFVKFVNYNHVMPTRYGFELNNINIATDDVKDFAKRKETRTNLKKQLQERFVSGKNRWFFTKLRF